MCNCQRNTPLRTGMNAEKDDSAKNASWRPNTYKESIWTFLLYLNVFRFLFFEAARVDGLDSKCKEKENKSENPGLHHTWTKDRWKVLVAASVPQHHFDGGTLSPAICPHPANLLAFHPLCQPAGTGQLRYSPWLHRAFSLSPSLLRPLWSQTSPGSSQPIVRSRQRTVSGIVSISDIGTG